MALEIGTKQAEMFYKLSIAAVQEMIFSVQEQSGTEVVPYWAVAEEESVDNPFWDSFTTIWTGDGGLGNRIFNVFDELFQQYRNVIIIGSDSPQITSQYILDAVNILDGGSANGVIGPCEDGGFVLFGSKIPVLKSLWTGIEYSKYNTLLQLTEKLDNIGFTYDYLPIMSDVDNCSDLEKLYNVLKINSKCNLSKQNELMIWINSILA